MKRISALLLAVVPGIIGLGAGYWLGVREGANIGLMLDSAPRGSIALIHIQAIEAGKTQNMVTMLESDVDNALLWNCALEGDLLSPLLHPLWGFDTPGLPAYLTRIANYRKEHPSPFTPEALAKPEPRNDEERKMRVWLIDGARENQQTISRMVTRYATKPAASQ